MESTKRRLGMDPLLVLSTEVWVEDMDRVPASAVALAR
jgi:hypothetical protein